jgi:hypothetical protein
MKVGHVSCVYTLFRPAGTTNAPANSLTQLYLKRQDVQVSAKTLFWLFIVQLTFSLTFAKTPEQKPSFLPCYTRTETVTSLRGPILGA